MHTSLRTAVAAARTFAVIATLAVVFVGAAARAEESWMASAWSSVAAGTKRGWKTTVDVVTLKPIRRTFAKKPTEVKMGFKPDPRRAKEPTPGLFSSLFAPKPAAEPRSMEEFMSLERPK